MENVLTANRELLFEESVNLTGFTEYGYSLNDLMEGNVPIPPEGITFDILFEGDLYGERLNGRIKGVDYLTIRADGRFFLDLHATLITDDGVNIKIKETGINKNGELLLDMSFHTNNEKYKWLNHEQIIGLGFADFNNGTATIKAYTIKNQ